MYTCSFCKGDQRDPRRNFQGHSVCPHCDGTGECSCTGCEFEQLEFGKYRVKNDWHVHRQGKSFTMRKGGIVSITQIDKRTGKVLICFGERDIDWFYKAVLDRLEKI